MNTLEIIHKHNRFSGKAGLNRIKAVCKALGNPQDKLKFVHIAGTNGKGSTATMIANVLEKAGYKTGLYTSPYLVKFNERIRINGVMIDDSSLDELVKKVYEAECKLELESGESIGEFEFVTALGFLYFLNMGCDIVVLETGLGGVYDATNIIKKPEVAVITPISFDHVAVLGNSLEQIAQAKAGIIKKGCRAVTAYGQDKAVLSVLKEVKGDIKIPEQVKNKKSDLNGSSFDFTGQSYKISMTGEHQIQNAQTALQTLFELRELGFNISDSALKLGLETAKISGRMEKIKEKPLVLLDGGHNIDGVKSIASTVKMIGKGRKIKLVVGMVADKDVKASTSILSDIADSVVVTMPKNPRSMHCDELAKFFDKNKIAGVYENSFDAFENAKGSKQDDVVIICGSLYLVGEAKSFFE